MQTLSNLTERINTSVPKKWCVRIKASNIIKQRKKIETDDVAVKKLMLRIFFMKAYSHRSFFNLPANIQGIYNSEDDYNDLITM